MARPSGRRQDVAQPPLEAGLEPLRDRRGLRPRERLFVEAYCGVANMNAAKAYELAGYKPGRENAARLTTKDHIKAAIDEGLEERRRRLVMDDREAKERLTQIARGSIKPFLHPDDPLLKCDAAGVRLISDAELALIKSITPNRYGRKIELHDPVHCTELMAKIAGALKDTVKVEHTLEDIVAGAFMVGPAA